MYYFFYALAWLPLKIMFFFLKIDKKKLSTKKTIFVCNHRLNWDPILLSYVIKGKPYILAKQESFKGIKGWFLRVCGAIPVNREKVELSTIKQCLSVLKKGQNLIVFPEGTRNKTQDDLTEIKGGVALFAIKGNAQVQPLWIEKKPKPFIKNQIKVGEPFNFNELENTKLDADAFDKSNKIIREKLLETKEL